MNRRVQHQYFNPPPVPVSFITLSLRYVENILVNLTTVNLVLLIFLWTYCLPGASGLGLGIELNDESSEEQYFSNRHRLRGFVKSYDNENTGNGTDVGLSPPVGNLATNAIITANATCGVKEPETYCKLTEHVNTISTRSRTRASQCHICDANSPDKNKRHPIANAIDGSARWWQSPSLQNGKKYEWISITIDLRQVYQVAYIVIKAAVSPRPGNWILERSLDGINYFSWQYFAITDEECLSRYGVVARPGKPSYLRDDEVICTSYYSKITPFEGGEIHASLVNGRPGADGPSETLVKFTMARYIKFRLQKIRTLNADLMGISWDATVMRRYYYSIKDIAIGGHCVCFGHSNTCIVEKCVCQHNTCGNQCEKCCPMYNQYPWGPGNSTSSVPCEKCQCYGHADSCVYDAGVHTKQLSINTKGHYEGGGVCVNCRAHTAGINCNTCERGYYRPANVPLDDPQPCVKCLCNLSPGSTGDCITEDHVEIIAIENKSIGDCLCKPGFTGKMCDKCTMGFRGYPKCEPCPCNMAGILNMDCEGSCICKNNVEGDFCNICKKGYYNLDKSNPNGCTQCFCHGATTECRSSNYEIAQISPTNSTWFLTDLHGTKVVPAISTGTSYQIPNEEFSNFEIYYWTSKEFLSGKNIATYGLKLSFHVSWTEARGDSSGRLIQDFDVIIQSMSSMLAFSHNVYEGNNATITVTLDEHHCYVLPDIDNSISGSSRPLPGTPCSRYDIMESLSDIKQVLLRAKFHTDQIDCLLHDAYVEKADPEALLQTPRRAVSVEICNCPPGYLGDSCELCGYGYRKSTLDSWLNECIDCKCNGNSRSCDLMGNCDLCEHYSTGKNCERCIEGYYGDPTIPNMPCKPCACPLLLSSNNFSPVCKLSGESYMCTQCQLGYEGPFCERCAEGFYGNPTEPGGKCIPCNCGNSGEGKNNICDHLTGECYLCPKNIGGWNCDQCLEGFYGDPENGTCIPCECGGLGSVHPICQPLDGQCVCHDRFMGRTCETCIPGCGNVAEGCPSCNCDVNGSEGDDCDNATGQCFCKSGVGGRYCNQCLDLHYGFSSDGCKACACHSNGSDSAVCDLITGQCHCLRNVENRRCDSCVLGFWNIGSGVGCEACECDPVGSLITTTCDVYNGQCLCKPGVGGLRCDKCADNHYGFSSLGCSVCDKCVEHGQICHPETGKCSCPLNSESFAGGGCKCNIGYWGFSETSGCEPCNCSLQGSTGRQCSIENGKCSCNKGFEGEKCDSCQFGYFNYPKCTPCDCDLAGTLEHFCDPDGKCSCDEFGFCPCKENTTGMKCDRCKEGTFGLSKYKSDGCTECFCFHRTGKCSEGLFKWNRLALSHERNVKPTKESGMRLNVINNLIVVPENGAEILIDKEVAFTAPLYWQLPLLFLMDKVLSYGGYLRFRAISETGIYGTSFPADVLYSYPLIQIQGNYKLILEHFPKHLNPSGYYEVQLHENFWKLKHGPSDGLVTKEILMVALQNLQHILIRGTNSPEFINAKLFNVSMDIAVPLNSNDSGILPANGIEVCECPTEYNSTSCQNPKVGYYRWYKKEYITSTVIIDLVGEAKLCQCNGRSNICDTETGICKNCSHNTAGRFCDQCQTGMYPVNTPDICLPCPCPTIHNIHAHSCQKIDETNFQCFCSPGYTGKSCEKCDYGYFSPRSGGECRPCNCNTYGSVSDECHEITGQCNCRSGITGRDCSECAAKHIIIGRTCTSCDDSCTGTLLNDLDGIERMLATIQLSPEVAAVLIRFGHLDKESRLLENSTIWLQETQIFIDDIPNYDNLVSIILARAKELELNAKDINAGVIGAKQNAKRIQTWTMSIVNRVKETIFSLHDYIKSSENASSVNIPLVLTKLAEVLEYMKSTSFDQIKKEAMDEFESSKITHQLVLSSLLPKVSDATERNFTSIRGKLDDIRQFISQAMKDSIQTDKTIITAKELLENGRANSNAIQQVILEMDMKNVMALDMLNRGSHVVTEINEVLMMTEDIIRDLRNLTKEVEIKENYLYEYVPLYRVQYAQPAFDHAKFLKQEADYLNRLFYFATSNTSAPIQTINTYEKIKQKFENALEIAIGAQNFSLEGALIVQGILRNYSLSKIIEDSTNLIRDGEMLEDIIKQTVKIRFADVRSKIEQIKRELVSSNETLYVVEEALKFFKEARLNLRLHELQGSIDNTLDYWDEVLVNAMETETRIVTELQAKFNIVKRIAAVDPIVVERTLNDVEAKLNSAPYIAANIDRIKVRKESAMETAESKIKRLKALIAQSKHKANTVGVSIGPDDEGTCLRLYKPPEPVFIDITMISFNFAPNRLSDSLLFYWPSSITDDFIAIEMVGLQLKASWDLGSGVTFLMNPLKLSKNQDGETDPDNWYKILFNRIGQNVEFIVKSMGSSQQPKFERVAKYPQEDLDDINNSTSTVFDYLLDDLIHIGGMTKRRPNLVSNGLSGCVHNLIVNDRSIGLWNFVQNEGCGPCTECTETKVAIQRDYYFDGRGYSLVNRVQSQSFHTMTFDVDMEFRTYVKEGLLFLAANENSGHVISLEIRESNIVFQVRHSLTNSINSIKVISLKNPVNTGEWIRVQAIWVFEDGIQTGLLAVGGEEYKEEREAFDLSLDLYKVPYQIGGLSPEFYLPKWSRIVTNTSFVGCMRNLVIDGNSFDPLLGQYHGVETPCAGKRIHVTSFDGNGFAEYVSHPINRDQFRLGFSFKTMSPTGLLLLSTFSESQNPQLEPYYGIYMENGQIKFHFQGNDADGEDNLVVEIGDTRFDDGNLHSFRFVKRNHRIAIFLDDEQILTEKFIIKTIPSPINHGLFIGGVPEKLQQKFNLGAFRIRNGFSGCIQNLYFDEELQNFNHPISYLDQHLDKCPNHHDSSSLVEVFDILDVGPRLTNLGYIRPEDKCPTATERVVQTEELKEALHFGDSPDSFVAFALDGNKSIKQDFSLSFSFRTFYPNGLLFQAVRKKGHADYCILAYLKDGQIILKFFGNRPQDVVSRISNLNDGFWHKVSVVRAGEKMFLQVDAQTTAEAMVPKKAKPLTRLYLGGVPADGSNCLENSVQRPEAFKGCIKGITINSVDYNFLSKAVTQFMVNPCITNVQSGTLFHSDSYAIYGYNFTMGNLLELELEFRTDSKNGELLSFVPNLPYKYPTFALYIQDSQVIATKAPYSISETYESVQTFNDDKNYICSNHWHTVKAVFQQREISLKVDSFEIVYSLQEPIQLSIGSEHNIPGTLYVGGGHHHNSLVRSTEDVKKKQFSGCIRNLSINRNIRDWSDMPVLSTLMLNSCPV